MRSLYEIDSDIMSCVDSETGEIIDIEKLEDLQIERNEKIHSVYLYIRNLNAQREAVKSEKERFARWEKTLTNNIDSLKLWLTNATGKEPVEFKEGKITFRKSEETVVDDAICPKKWMVRKVEWKPDKDAIKKAIKQGTKIRGCSVIEKMNIQIK